MVAEVRVEESKPARRLHFVAGFILLLRRLVAVQGFGHHIEQRRIGVLVFEVPALKAIRIRPRRSGFVLNRGTPKWTGEQFAETSALGNMLRLRNGKAVAELKADYGKE